jgi:dethiobiotin synthetase
MAAAELGQPSYTVEDLVQETTWPDGIDLGVMETVGGPRSPIACDGDSVDLAARVQPDITLMVADAGLGAINAVQLAIAALAELRGRTIVVLNRYVRGDRLHAMNRQWLEERLPADVVTTPPELAVRLMAAP